MTNYLELWNTLDPLDLISLNKIDDVLVEKTIQNQWSTICVV